MGQVGERVQASRIHHRSVQGRVSDCRDFFRVSDNCRNQLITSHMQRNVERNPDVTATVDQLLVQRRPSEALANDRK